MKFKHILYMMLAISWMANSSVMIHAQTGNDDTTTPIIFCPGSPAPELAEVACLPTFSEGGFDDFVDGVRITNAQGELIMDNSNTGYQGGSGYSFFPPVENVTTCVLHPGQEYSLEMDFVPFFQEYWGAWLDLNNDGDFDDQNEWLSESVAGSPSNAVSFTFSFSNLGITPGPHRLRTMLRFAVALDQYDNCVISQYGDCEDYVVSIEPELPTLSCSSIPNYTNSVFVNDEVFSSITITQEPLSAEYSPDLMVTLTATDDSGNSSSCSFPAFAEDYTQPTIVCPETIIAWAFDSVYIDIPNPLVSDDCTNQSDISITNNLSGTSNPSGYYFFGDYTIEYSVMDLSGNISTCQFDVNVGQIDNGGCTTDLDDDGMVNMNDLLLVLNNFGCINSCPYDVNDDGIVSSLDLQLVIGDFGQSCN